MEPLGVDEKTAKRPGSQMSAPAIWNKIDQKLHRLARLVYSGVSTPTEKAKDVKAEAGGQKPADVKAGDQRPADVEAEGQRSEGQRVSESELEGPRPAGSRPELEDK